MKSYKSIFRRTGLALFLLLFSAGPLLAKEKNEEIYRFGDSMSVTNEQWNVFLKQEEAGEIKNEEALKNLEFGVFIANAITSIQIKWLPKKEDIIVDILPGQENKTASADMVLSQEESKKPLFSLDPSLYSELYEPVLIISDEEERTAGKSNLSTQSSADNDNISALSLYSKEEEKESQPRLNKSADVWTVPYEGANYYEDGSDNTGQLGYATDSVTGENYYRWETSQIKMQDYSISFPVLTGADFTGFETPAFSINVRTSSNKNEESRLEIKITDTAGNEVFSDGSVRSEKNGVWYKYQISLPEGSGDFSSGSVFRILLKLSAVKGQYCDVGSLNVNRKTNN